MNGYGYRWLCIVCLVTAVALAAGCGRPTLPGQQFRGERAETETNPPTTSPLPQEPFFEAGAAEARVRVVAFFPIDAEHRVLMDLLRDLAEEYPGKVYVQYVDYRTREGDRLYTLAEMPSPGLLINGQKAYDIQAEPNPYTVDFMQEMGRYWTPEDLERAVAQEVEAVYGPEAAAGD